MVGKLSRKRAASLCWHGIGSCGQFSHAILTKELRAATLHFTLACIRQVSQVIWKYRYSRSTGTPLADDRLSARISNG